MNIAVLADIHANPAALHAVIEDVESWSPDLVIVAGDMVGRGPLPRACLELVLRMRDERGWQVIRGNHERYVLVFEQERQRPDFPTSGPQYEVSRMAAWTHSQVADMIPQITELPEARAQVIEPRETYRHFQTIATKRKKATRTAKGDTTR